MNRISILGCGWLGKPLAIYFLECGFKVKGSTTSEEKLSDLESYDIESFLVDITDFEEYNDFLDADILIVAITSKDIDGFERLITQIQNSEIQKVIFISSTSVYPSLNKVMTEEDAVLENPLTEIENLFKENIFFETTVIRFSGLFGGERHPANWFKNGRKIPQPKGFVNMIHREDCIDIIHEVIAQDCWNEVFNACSNHHPTRREFYTIAKLSKDFEVPEFEDNEVYEWKIISSKKVQRVLGYVFIYDDLLSF
ncbi:MULTISPECIES: NAD(P)-binding domain-containing protein [unclassified Polaribacter]|uniref:NAD(P)-binding domain-containing protein n=1 Tax=unclassified Polaribacter TaxID=196858 RepID=UPI0011BD813C|nr:MULTISPECIES: NAD(P)-binding domain-containing protein [unclassified Polaribacter]TXD50819.1 dTDP-glucose 4,6-dehydratase [Polaribacter sp. IC063]TXD57525.1 dTDP-glucose 4,6-dehydratase [Polaribacter sp. IC066]